MTTLEIYWTGLRYTHTEDTMTAPNSDSGIAGMTIREHYAGLAMQGLLANPELVESSDAEIADWAVFLADSLCRALAQPPRKPPAIATVWGELE